MTPKLEYILLAFGIWTIGLSYLGFTRSFKNLLYTITGLLLVILAYLVYQRKKDRLKRKTLATTQIQ